MNGTGFYWQFLRFDEVLAPAAGLRLGQIYLATTTTSTTTEISHRGCAGGEIATLVRECSGFMALRAPLWIRSQEKLGYAGVF